MASGTFHKCVAEVVAMIMFLFLHMPVITWIASEQDHSSSPGVSVSAVLYLCHYVLVPKAGEVGCGIEDRSSAYISASVAVYPYYNRFPEPSSSKSLSSSSDETVRLVSTLFGVQDYQVREHVVEPVGRCPR